MPHTQICNLLNNLTPNDGLTPKSALRHALIYIVVQCVQKSFELLSYTDGLQCGNSIPKVQSIFENRTYLVGCLILHIFYFVYGFS